MRTFCIYGALIYLAVINIVAFFLYGIDKWKARHDKWRITEARLLWIAVAGGSIGALLGMKARLLWIAVAGGSIGALLGMKVWHHKTKHNKFRFGLPAILILQIAAILAALYCYYFVN